MTSPLLSVDLPFASAPPEPLVTLVLPLRPKAKARPRLAGAGHAFEKREDKQWRKAAIGYAKAVLPAGLCFDEALRLDFFAIYERNQDLEKDPTISSGFLVCPQFGDVDNLRGSVMDALGSVPARAKRNECLWGSHGLWTDDNLIVCGEPVKLRARRGEMARVVLFVSRPWIPKLLMDRLEALPAALKQARRSV